MKITCQACGAKYTIADDKVRGRKVKIRCKGCSAPIVVDAQQGEAEGGAIEASGASEMTGADAGLEIAAQSSPPAAEAWSVNLSDTDQRNMTTEEIVAGYASGLVTADAFVWKDGMADWTPVLECAELASLLAAPAAAPAAAKPAATFPAPRAAAGARLAGGRSAGAVDLFGGVETAGSEEEEVATSAPAVGAAALPQAGSTAYDDGKLTGARNENSVLFSLDALKASVPAEAPKKGSPTKPGAPPRKGPAAPSSGSDPFGMGGANDLMNIGGGGNPLFSLNANQALLTAPAPPEPPASRATDMNVSGSLSASEPKKSKTLLIGGGVAALLLVAIAGFAFSGDKKEDATAETPSASAAVAAEAPKVEEKKEEPKVEEKKEEPKPEESPAPAASASASAAPVATEAPKAAGGGAPKGGGGAAKEKEEPAPVAAGPFNKSSAVAQLTSAANSAQGCKKGGGPTGMGKVQVTFAPSGRVTSATVQGGPFAGTPTGGCVASLFRRAKVPPFSGSAITVSKSFMVN